MGTARSVLFTASSILMIFAGVLGLITAGLITSERLHTASASITVTIITAAAIVVYSVIDIIFGISGAKKYNRRINSSVIIFVPEIGLAVCVVAVVFALFNGVRVPHIIFVILSGIAVPLLFIFSAVKKSTLK